MKKSVFVSLLALATLFPGTVSMVYAQAAQPSQLTIKDQQEYNDYSNAIGQSGRCEVCGHRGIFDQVPQHGGQERLA